MTDDKDFKRLVRRRMAKTGESYTAARAHLRPGGSGGSGLAAFRTRYERTGLEGLGRHLESEYGIAVARLTELDLGVFRVDRDAPGAGAGAWVARVFPALRSEAAVRADAAVLDFLAAHEFRAERCAAGSDSVSTLDGQPVLVTEYVPGVNGRGDVSGPTLFALGEQLGRLHELGERAGASVGAAAAGGWHHISLDGGGVAADVEALQPLLDEVSGSAPDEARGSFAQVQERLAAVDPCADLPHTLIHPDPCGANAVIAGDGTPVLVDWAGAGQGPRVLSLAALLAGSLQPAPGVPASRDLRRVDAVVAGYRRHARVTPAELTRLAGAVAAGGTVLDCWMLLVQDMPVRAVATSMGALVDLGRRVAERAAAAFEADEDSLTAWFTPARPTVDPAQGALF